MRISSDTFSSASPKSIITGILAGLAVIAFAVTGFGGSLGKNFDSNVAAHVGKQEVSIRSLNDLVQEYERQQGDRGDPERRKANIQNALNQLIQEKLLVEEATRAGWNSTDLEVAHWIRSVPAFQDEKTKAFRPELYQRFLKSGRMTELELFKTGRENISRTKIQALFSLPVKTPDKLILEKYNIDNTQFEVEYLEVKPAPSALAKATEEAAQKFAADPANTKVLQASYDSAKEEFEHKAQLRLRGILIGWKDAQRAQGDALKRTKAQAKDLAQATRERLAGGAKFAQLASETNDDPVAKSKMGDLGWVDDSRIDPETLNAAQKLKLVGGTQQPISDVIETAFGFRVVQLVDTRPEIKKSFDEAKLELAKRQVQSGISAKLSAEIEVATTKALTDKNLNELANLTKTHEWTWKKLPKPVSAKDRFVEGIGVTDSLIPALFGLKKPQEITSTIINITARNFVFRLVSRKDSPAPTSEQIQEAAQTERALFARNFQSDSERKLFEKYTRENDIKRNPALTQFE